MMFTAAMRPRKTPESSRMGEGIATDRISDLPDHIIHNILCFLPTKDAARTNALSKKFRFAWTSFPIIDFDHMNGWDFQYNTGIEGFLNFVHDSLIRRAPNISVEKFRLHVRLNNIKSDNRIDRAISYAVEHKVKELDLDVRSGSNVFGLFYKLPSILISVNSITALKLKGLNLETLDLTKFPSSKELSLISCNGLYNLSISNAQLDIMEVESCRDLFQIDIYKSNLRSFSFTGTYSGLEYEACEINLADCESLVNLKLKEATITSEWFNNVSRLLLLENLILCNCDNLKNIYIPNPRLKILEISNCIGLEKIEIVAMNLESFLYNGECRQCKIMITACKLLRNLELHYANVTDGWVEKNVSELPFLENLKLCHCDKLRTLQVSHEELKNFQLIGCSRFEKAIIYARNLISFRYDGEVIHLPLSVDSPHLEAELVLNTDSESNTDKWYKELRNFLGYFDHCKLLTLDCIEKFLIFPEEVREILLPPLFDIRHLKVKIYSQSKDIVSLVDSLLWLSPLLETISIIVSGYDAESSLKFQYAKPVAMEEMDLFCCHSRIIKCWRHHLKKVSMENFQDSDREKLMYYFRSEAMRLHM